MSDNKNGCSCVTAVGCSVENCTYHTLENRCGASRINVQNEKAMQKGETFCATFTPKH
ncbi:MAG: DUF1540 domain-containing protein [Candidatus Heteroscillospira sp.]|jgi:hypothetical protein